jgi:uncharacterized protein (TIGR02147 family)
MFTNGWPFSAPFCRVGAVKDQEAITLLLRSRYLEIQGRNPGYSIRSFAKKLGIGVSTLSMILNGQRRASRRLASQFADRLLLDPIERASLLERFDREKFEIKKPVPRVIRALKASADQYVAFSEWHYMAILNLVRMKSFRNDPAWIADRLDLTPRKVSDAIERLKRLGMLKETPSGNLKRTGAAFRTTDDVANLSVRKGHFDTLERARAVLETDPVELRDFSWVTLPIQKARLPEIKQFIRKFQQEFLAQFSEDPASDEVYRLAVQMIPLTRPKSGAEK